MLTVQDNLHEQPQPLAIVTNKQGRKPGDDICTKYDFDNFKDKLAIENGLREFGHSYADIQKTYFPNCVPPVTRMDIQNYVRKNPYLLKIAKTGTI